MKEQDTLIRNAKIYVPNGVIENGWILVNREGKIEQIGHGERGISPDTYIIEADGNSIIPGFIDIHIHGGNGSSVMDGTYEALSAISTFHAEHGTTSFLATTTTGSKENILKALTCAS